MRHFLSFVEKQKTFKANFFSSPFFAPMRKKGQDRSIFSKSAKPLYCCFMFYACFLFLFKNVCNLIDDVGKNVLSILFFQKKKKIDNNNNDRYIPKLNKNLSILQLV